MNNGMGPLKEMKMNMTKTQKSYVEFLTSTLRAMNRVEKYSQDEKEYNRLCSEMISLCRAIQDKFGIEKGEKLVEIARIASH